jgi:hypothetical protein
VVGGSVGATYSGDITQANNAALVSVSGGHTGTLTFQTGTLSATNGTGLQFNNADGTYNFNGTTTLNGGAAGMRSIVRVLRTLMRTSHSTPRALRVLRRRLETISAGR